MNLNHFRLLRVVGRGAFGKVRIVERKDTNLSFALKYIRKDEGMRPSKPSLPIHHLHPVSHYNDKKSIFPSFSSLCTSCHPSFSSKAHQSVTTAVVRSESVRNIIRERRMLEHVNHPFICNLRYSFQDIEYMYDPRRSKHHDIR